MIRMFLFLLAFFSFSFASPPSDGENVYTIQVASLKKKEDALKFVRKLGSLPDLRISFRNGRYKVRIGFFKSYQEAEEFARKHGFSRLFRDYYITRINFSSQGVEFIYPEKGESPEEETIGNSTENGSSGEYEVEELVSTVSDNGLEEEPLLSEEEENESGEVEVNTTSDFNVAFPAEIEGEPKGVLAENRTSENVTVTAPPEKKEENRRIFLYLPILILPLIIALILKKRSDGYAEGKGIEELVAELVSKGDFEKVVEVALPYVEKSPEDTFVRKALAESYEELGRFAEAAGIYSEMVEILRRKGLDVLAGEFEKRAEDLLVKEFRKKGG
ncbi:MAG: SPOR domain-containing protein [Desulfurobacteriaceae bacterium]